MSVAEIDRRLENRFALLRGGSRDVPERHQTLLAVIDWSWNLLDESERTALRRLSIFRDGFSLGGADAVIDGDALGPLSSLVDQSLVTVVEGAGELRYRLLETVREFGQMQLIDAGDDVETARPAAATGESRSRDARRRSSSGRAQVETMAEIRTEEGNLVDLLRRCLRERDVDAVVELMACLSDFWTVEGSHLKVVNLAHDVEDVVADARGRRRPDAGVPDDARLDRVQLDDLLRRLHRPRAMTRLEELDPGTGRTRSEAQAMVLLAARRGLAERRLRGDRAALRGPRASGSASSPCSGRANMYENLGDLAEARHPRRALARARRRQRRAVAAGTGLRAAGRHADPDRRDGRRAPVRRRGAAGHGGARRLRGRRPAQGGAGHGGDAGRPVRRGRADLRRDRGSRTPARASSAPRSSCSAAVPSSTWSPAGSRTGCAATATPYARLINRPVPGLGGSIDYEPWIYFPEAAALSAHVRHGRRELAAGAARRPAREGPEHAGGRAGLHRLPGGRLGDVRAGRVGAVRRPGPGAARSAPYACSSSPTCSATTGSCPA